MAAIVRSPVATALHGTAGDPWPAIVGHALAWARGHGVVLRDAVLLVPFAQHLNPARRACAKAGGWLPRIETTQTLARSLGPAAAPTADALSFRSSFDKLTALRLLAGQSWATAWQRHDPLVFEQAVAAMVRSAHDLARAAAAVAPAGREAWFERGRGVLSTGSAAAAVSGTRERLLARIALEWAAAAPVPVTDALFALRPSAWIVVQAGGADALTGALLQHAADVGIRVLCLDTDAPDDALAQAASSADTTLSACAGFEDEAQRTAAQVLARLAARAPGEPPVALIAQDRVLVRRVRALLARRGVPLLDETGWKLSTTRAGAAVVALLRAAAPQAGTDDVLDWLKTCPPRALGGALPLLILEQRLRRHARARAAAVRAEALSGTSAEAPGNVSASAAALWQRALDCLQPLRTAPRQPLRAWLAQLSAALGHCGLHAMLADDEAGAPLLQALGLDDAAAMRAIAQHAEAMGQTAFRRWVEDVLEDASFRPAAPAVPAVVITPLVQAVLRPFAAVVLPGADHRHLGARPGPHPLLSQAQAAELGVPGVEAQRQAERLAFEHVLGASPVDLLFRRDDEGEPLSASPLVERLNLARARAGRGVLPAAADAREALVVVDTPARRPAPAAPQRLPARLSASACEALRVCPYRFFAQHVLGLREARELDDEIEKRDFGTWMHAVLQRFHASRAAPEPAPMEVARLQAVADALQAEMHLAEDDFLPFAASFKRFAPRYIAWLHERDAQGARWLEGERTWTARPPAWGGTEMYGVIDRIDSAEGHGGPITQLIDYKTGSVQGLRQRVREPAEDTQLAFYAALTMQQSHALGEVGAMYLAIDDAEGIKSVEHPGVEATARRLVAGLGDELARLRNGAAMPALGEGIACEYCEARGLCRRDQWAP